MTDLNNDVLDMEVIGALRALEDEGAPGLFEELVDLFLSDTPPRLLELVAASDAGDLKAVEAGAHSLKSSCGNLGAQILVDLFKQIEHLGREDVSEGVADLVAKSQHEFDRVHTALTAAK